MLLWGLWISPDPAQSQAVASPKLGSFCLQMSTFS